jgi:signal transduction histidine kinase
VSFLAATALAAVTANVCLGAFVLLYRRGRLINQLFFAFSICLAAWCLAVYMLANPVGEVGAVLSARCMVYASLLASVLFLHLVLRLFGSPPRLLLVTAYLTAVMLLLSNLGGLMISGARELSGPGAESFWYGTAGRLAWLSPLYNVSVIGLAVVQLFVTARNSHGIRRAQANYMMVAIVPPTVIGLHDFVGLFFTSYPGTNVLFVPMIPIASVFWASLVAYTILRYRLIDLDAAIIRGMTHALMLVILIGPCALGIVAAEQVYFRTVQTEFSMIAIGLSALAVLLFPRVRQVTQVTLQGVLLRGAGDYRTALFKFSRESSQILDLSELVARLNEALISALGVTRACVYLAEAAGGCRLRGAQESIGSEGSRLPSTLEPQDPIVDWLKDVQEPVVREELQLEGRPLARHVAAAMEAIDAEVALPMVTPERFEGIVFLGAKRSGAMFTQEDIEILTILANQVGISMENARLYADLKRSRELIQRSDRLSAIGTMAAGLAHEIRNPLVSIRTFTQLLPERIEDEEFRSKFLALTLSEVDRICALINELLAFARPAPAQFSRVDLNVCLEGICLLLESQARNRGVYLRTKLKPGLRMITADEDQVKQVVMNVVLNAIQACSDGGAVDVTSYESVVDEKAYLCIEITDSGRGIESDLLPHIFDPFFTTRRDGTGLGLSIAHQIVTRHGGFIEVKSEIGRGTTFFINLSVSPPIGSPVERPILETDDLRLHG